MLGFLLIDSLIGGLVFQGVSPLSICFCNGRGKPGRVIFHPLSAEPEEEDKGAILEEARRRQWQHRLDQISCHSGRLACSCQLESNGMVAGVLVVLC